MATATLLSPEAPTSTTANKILDFFHSLLLFLLNTLRRALQSVSRIGRSSSSPSHPHHNTFTSAPDNRSSLAAMAPTTAPPNRLQPPKVVPALPLLPSRMSSPQKDSKENTAPSRKEAGPLPQYQPQAQFRKTEPAEKLTDRLSHLDLNAVNGGGTAGAVDTTASPSPSSPAQTALPVFIPCPPLPIPEPLVGERAIHSGFMREALDMVRTVALPSVVSLALSGPRGFEQVPCAGIPPR
jgi:tRNA-specific adenosine deaminase 2